MSYPANDTSCSNKSYHPNLINETIFFHQTTDESHISNMICFTLIFWMINNLVWNKILVVDIVLPISSLNDFYNFWESGLETFSDVAKGEE